MGDAFKNKVVWITGASRGIGRACAEMFAAEGARLALCASTSIPELPRLARGMALKCDVSRSGEVFDAHSQISVAVGPVDILVLNAGVLERAPVDKLTEKQWDRVLDVNLKGAFLVTRTVWPSMVARKAGRIIAVGSISGTLGTAESSAYNASKWGLTGFIKSLAEEGREHGIFCASVLPTGVDTEMIKKTPFKPAMQPGEVARVVKFLAGESPFAMTGSAVEAFG